MTFIFISYSRKDFGFAEQLESNLLKWGYSVWRDVNDLPKGSRWDDEIERQLGNCDLLIGVISPDAVASPNVKDEWAWALDHGKALVLLRFRDAQLPLRYTRINNIDFTQSLETGFETLRRDLLKKLELEASTSLSPEVRKHVEKYWQLCRQFFAQSDYALALFFALTLIDEVGTMIILGFRNAPDILWGFELKRTQTRESEPFDIDKVTVEERRRMVIRLTIVINHRVDQLYKREERIFGRWAREDKFPTLLKNSIYMHGSDKQPITPSEIISRDDAFIMVCLAGEIYGEVQGEHFTGVETPNEWLRVLKEVDDFREKYRQQNGNDQ